MSKPNGGAMIGGLTAKDRRRRTDGNTHDHEQKPKPGRIGGLGLCVRGYDHAEVAAMWGGGGEVVSQHPREQNAGLWRGERYDVGSEFRLIAVVGGSENGELQDSGVTYVESSDFPSGLQVRELMYGRSLNFCGLNIFLALLADQKDNPRISLLEEWFYRQLDVRCLAFLGDVVRIGGEESVPILQRNSGNVWSHGFRRLSFRWNDGVNPIIMIPYITHGNGRK